MTQDDIREHAARHGLSLREAQMKLEKFEIEGVIDSLDDKKLRIIFNYIIERIK